jgi:hypothetical protein
MTTVTVNKSHSTINIGANASYIVNGDDDTILVGSNSTVTANGSALSVQVTGAGSVVTIGGNGVAASNTNDNVVLFKGVTGTLHELANSRVDVTANLVVLTMAGNDALGVYGSGDSVTAAGAGDALWIGQNGFDVTGAALDFVTGLTHGSIYEMQGSSIETSGSYYAVTLNAQDLLLAGGLGVHVTVTAAGDNVEIGGNGAGASNTDEDVVLFQAAGTIGLTANSRVDTTGNLVTANLSGNDTFGLYGSGDSVTAGGTGDAIWIGQNGAGATGAAYDLVHSLTNGSVFEMQGSDLGVDGTNYSVAMSGADTLTTFGSGVNVSVSGTNNTLVANNTRVTAASASSFELIGGDDMVAATGASVSVNGTNNSLVLKNSTVNATFASSFDLFGDNNTVNATGGGPIQILGGGNHVTAGQGETVLISQNHDANLATDVVQWGNAPIAPITVEGYTSASLIGSSATINLLGSQSNVTVTGSNDTVSETNDANGNAITIGGNGSTYGAAGQDKVTLNPFDHVVLLANSNVAASSAAGATASEDSVQMAANDSLSIGAGVAVQVGLGLGDDYLANFASTDVLNLSAHFTSVNDLLAHTGLNHLNQTTIQLDTTGDFLSLGISKTTLATYANEGLVKFT